MLLAAELLNTQGHTVAKSGDELIGPMPSCLSGKFYWVLTCNQQTQTPHLRDYQTELLSGSLKMADNECEMTHVTFKQDSGCVCEWELLKIPLGCCGSHQSLSGGEGGRDNAIANFNTNW